MDVDKVTRDTIAQGGILALLYFDLHANRKETLAQLGAGLVQKLISEEGVVYAMGEIDEPMENKDVFSSSVEVKILTKGMLGLAKLCGTYSPFSIEVLRPEEVRMTVDQAHALLMDIAVGNYELKKLIIEKVYKPEDLAVFRRAMEGRLEVGKKLLEKKK